MKQEIATLNGVQLAIDREVMSPAMVDIIQNGKYEQAEAREIARLVQPGERVVELGSGLGFVAITAIKTGHVASLTAYEANPRLIPLIERNAALNGVSFDVHNAIVDARPSAPTAPFYVRENFWASSLSPKPWGYKAEIAVPVVSFDEVRDSYRPTLLVVDIEGGEEALFRHASLTGVKKIFVELHQKVIGRVGMKNIFDYLSAHDFHYDQHHSHGAVVLFSHVLR